MCICLSIQMGMLAMTYTQRSEEDFVELVFSFHLSMEFKDPTQGLRPVRQTSLPLNHPAGSYFNFLKVTSDPPISKSSLVYFLFSCLRSSFAGFKLCEAKLSCEMSGSVSSGKFLGQVEFLHTLCTPCTTAHPCTCTWELSCPP